MRLNLATLSLPSAATDTCEGNSPTGRLQGSLRGRVPNQAFDAATVLDSSLSSSSTPAETASRTSRHPALGGLAPVCNLSFGCLHGLTVQIKTAIACPRCTILSPPLASRPLCVSTSFIPSHLFRSGEHQSLPANFTSSSSCGTPQSSVRHSRFEHRGRLVPPEPANYVYVPEVREPRHLTARLLFHAVVRVRACQSQDRSTLCSPPSFLACSCTSRLSFRPRYHSPQNPLAIPSRQTFSLFLRSISFASLVRAYELAGLGSPLVPSPGDTTTFLSPRVDPILDLSLCPTIFTNRRQNGWSVAPLFNSTRVERASRLRRSLLTGLDDKMKVYLQYLLLLIGYLSLVNVRQPGKQVVSWELAVLTTFHRRAVSPMRFDGLTAMA